MRESGTGNDILTEAWHLAPVGRTLLRYLIVSEFPHVNSYPLMGIERAMRARGLTSVCNPQNPVDKWAAKVLSKCKLVANVRRSPRGPVFVACMGFSEFKTIPFCYWTELVPYCFDCWAPRWTRWESFFVRQRVRCAFFTARQAARHFERVLPKMASVWLPEAIDPAEYSWTKPLKDRRIDVLELGRKHDRYHSCIAKRLENAGRLHKYERVKGEIIFATAAEFRAGMGDAKISVCFPCSLTHPELSGSVETVTLRYFESFVSKCLVVGHCPKELADLFGYNPVIEVETEREFEQLECLLSTIDSYQLLVDRNRERVLEVATWEMRVRTILERVKSLGY